MDLDSAKKITIKSMEHYNTMIKDGFEVKQVLVYGSPQHLNTAIVLANGDQTLEADATAIDDYVLHLRELYDFDKQKTAFVYITDTEVYHTFEEELFTIFPSLPYGFKSRPIITKKPEIELWEKIIGRIEDWIRIEKGRKYGIKNISEIFFLACMVEVKAGSLTRKTINKETVTLDEIKRNFRSL